MNEKTKSELQCQEQLHGIACIANIENFLLLYLVHFKNYFQCFCTIFTLLSYLHNYYTAVLGEGTFSQVFSGNFNGSEVAIKRLKIPIQEADHNYFAEEVMYKADMFLECLEHKFVKCICPF